MKFKLDENVPVGMASFLVQKGHQVETVQSEGLCGAIDDIILKAAISENRVLLTFDLDFADIRAYPVGQHCGIVVFRLRNQAWSVLQKPIEQFLKEIDLEILQGSLTIVEETRVRCHQKN